MDRREDAKVMKFSDFFSIFNNLGEREALLVEILARLPSRAVVQLKLVCKSWCSLISSQYFITLFNHRRHDPSLPPILHDPNPSSSGCFIFQAAHDRCLSMVRWGYTQRDLFGRFHRPDLSFLPCPESTIRLNGSCGDLILCSNWSLTSPRSQIIFYYLCNPLTNQWTALPPAPKFQCNRLVGIATGLLCVPAPCSLCCPGSSDNNSPYNFMVVRICIVPSFVHSRFKFEAQLFLSEEGEWKSVVVSSPQGVRFRVRSSTTLVAYKGLLHWLISGFVLVYDPYNCPERFCRVIDMPADMIAADSCATTTGLFQDRLRVSATTIGLFQDRLRVTHAWHIASDDPVYYIWELEDYNMGKWSLVHKIHTRENPRLGALPDPHSDPPPHIDPIVNLDPKIRETGFSYRDGSAFYWTNSSTSSGWWVANGLVHWITDQWWPTPVPPLTCTVQNNENTLENS
nr:putative F-box/kelch-repeat protein At1g15680 [Ipomoea batatas]